MKNFLVVFLFLNFACSTSTITVKVASNVINKGISAFYEEDDLVLARASMEANIKLLEVFQHADPKNEKIKIILSQIYGGYTYAFLETDFLNEQNEDAKTLIKNRIAKFYSRGLDYSLSILKNENSNFKKALLASDFDKIENYAKKITNKEALFWSILNWSLLINAERTNPDRISEVTIVKSLIDRMIALDSSYFRHSPLSLKATINSVMPVMFGGNPSLAKTLFEEAILKDEKFLLHKLLYAQYLTPVLQDKEKFESLLLEIEQQDINLDSDMKLLNASVKIKAKLIYNYTSDLFMD